MKNKGIEKITRRKSASILQAKSNKGITLIALVVTIVVLLILAGISINLIFSEGGIIQKASDAVDRQQEAEESDKSAIESLGEQANALLNGGSSGGNSGSGGNNPPEENPGEGGGNSGNEGGSTGGDVPDESWKLLTADERAQKLQEEKPVTYLFYDGDGTSGSQYYTYEQHFNTIGYNKKLETEATCVCGHAREIFEKAKDMGLVTIYDQIEYIIGGETTVINGKELTGGRTFLTAPITEPSMVYYNFECNNQDQKTGGAIAMPYSIAYELSLDGGTTWLDGGKPNFGKTGGDYDTALTWLKEDYVQLGYTTIRVRAMMFPNALLRELEQTFTMNIQVLTQTDFMKAAKELNLDLSSYNCIHPNK